MSETVGFVKSFDCPHCGVRSQISTSMWAHDRAGIVHGIGKCMNEDCMRNILFVYETSEQEGRLNPRTTSLKLIYHYPISSITVHPAVPQNIAESFKEGIADLNINSQKSAVLMFRRALQEICEEKGADPSKKLNEQIDSIITNPDLLSLAHEIRQWGNIGGHTDDIIKNIQPNDANEIKELLERLFDYLYIMPWKIAQSKTKRSTPTTP